jgi:transcriptional regulator with XRE-family HTH domain
MINQIHFGKRIAILRRKANLSQTDLAEKLGVTSQAVSKWECGNAIPNIDLLLELSHLYHVSINEMLEDMDLLYELTGTSTEHTGIAYFVPEQEPPYGIEWANEMQRENWIKRNWEHSQTARPGMDAVGQEIASCDGIILEIGAGPGGGYMPYILKANPDATIIISDLSPTVVREWKSFLDKTLDSPNLYYAAFDFCHMPFKDNCIDIISDGGGIGNCIGQKAEALKEACRVLKPGGKLITSTGFVNKETLASLPLEAQNVLIDKRPDIFEDLYEDTVLAGFSKIDSVISGGWYTNDDESTIADLARSLGVNLKFTSYIRYCTKEQHKR